MTEPLKRFKPNTKMVPVPSRSIIPERDVNHCWKLAIWALSSAA